MAIRDKIRGRTQPFLEPGEEIRHIFVAQVRPNPWFLFLTYLIQFTAQLRVVAVTDRAVVVLDSKWATFTPVRVHARLPRATRFGPVSGLWSRIPIGDERMWVHRRFHKDVEEANAELDAGAPPAVDAG